MKYLLYFLWFVLFVSCDSGTEIEGQSISTEKSGASSIVMGSKTSGQTRRKALPENGVIHKVSVESVEESDRYSYMEVKEGNRHYWITTWKQEAKPGDVFYYNKGILKINMYSKALKRTLDTMYMVSLIGKSPDRLTNGQNMTSPSNAISSKAPTSPRPKDIKIVSLKQLIEHPDNFTGKTVTLMGKCTKVNNGILGKNWVHIQDDKGRDMVLTTQAMVELDQLCTFSGQIDRDVDLGSGYHFDIIMQNATLLE